ncbi:MAG: LPP20 family lipoprotein [Campylobacter sp.]
MKNFVFILATVAVFSGCSFHNPFASDFDEPVNSRQEIVVQKVDKDDIREVMKKEKMIFDQTPIEETFTAVGEGIAPMNTVSQAQALALAKRAAMADAHRQLAEQLYGVKISARDTVRDAMLRDSTITSQVNGLIKNANIVETSFKDGLYNIRMELRVDRNKWQEIFSY